MGDPNGFDGMPMQTSANLFSSVAAPEPSATGGSGSKQDPSYDSDDSKDGDDGKGGRRTAEQKAHAIQEKNRRAQKRFRERQVLWVLWWLRWGWGGVGREGMEEDG